MSQAPPPQSAADSNPGAPADSGASSAFGVLRRLLFLGDAPSADLAAPGPGTAGRPSHGPGPGPGPGPAADSSSIASSFSSLMGFLSPTDEASHAGSFAGHASLDHASSSTQLTSFPPPLFVPRSTVVPDSGPGLEATLDPASAAGGFPPPDLEALCTAQRPAELAPEEPLTPEGEFFEEPETFFQTVAALRAIWPHGADLSISTRPATDDSCSSCGERFTGVRRQVPCHVCVRDFCASCTTSAIIHLDPAAAFPGDSLDHSSVSRLCFHCSSIVGDMALLGPVPRCPDAPVPIFSLDSPAGGLTRILASRRLANSALGIDLSSAASAAYLLLSRSKIPFSHVTFGIPFSHVTFGVHINSYLAPRPDPGALTDAPAPVDPRPRLAFRTNPNSLADFALPRQTPVLVPPQKDTLVRFQVPTSIGPASHLRTRLALSHLRLSTNQPMASGPELLRTPTSPEGVLSSAGRGPPTQTPLPAKSPAATSSSDQSTAATSAPTKRPSPRQPAPVTPAELAAAKLDLNAVPGAPPPGDVMEALVRRELACFAPSWSHRLLDMLEPDMLDHFLRLLAQLLVNQRLALDWAVILCHLLAPAAQTMLRSRARTEQALFARQFIHVKKLPLCPATAPGPEAGGQSAAGSLAMRRRSDFVGGLVFSKDLAHRKMPSFVAEPRVLLLKNGFDFSRHASSFGPPSSGARSGSPGATGPGGESVDTGSGSGSGSGSGPGSGSGSGPSPGSGPGSGPGPSLGPGHMELTINDREVEYHRSMIALLYRNRPDAIFLGGSASRLGIDMLLRQDPSPPAIFTHVKPRILQLLSRLTGAEVVDWIDRKPSVALGRCEAVFVSHHRVGVRAGTGSGVKTLTFLTGRGETRVGTVVLCGAPAAELTRVKNVLLFLLHTVVSMVRESALRADMFMTPARPVVRSLAVDLALWAEGSLDGSPSDLAGGDPLARPRAAIQRIRAMAAKQGFRLAYRNALHQVLLDYLLLVDGQAPAGARLPVSVATSLRASRDTILSSSPSVAFPLSKCLRQALDRVLLGHPAGMEAAFESPWSESFPLVPAPDGALDLGSLSEAQVLDLFRRAATIQNAEHELCMRDARLQAILPTLRPLSRGCISLLTSVGNAPGARAPCRPPSLLTIVINSYRDMTLGHFIVDICQQAMPAPFAGSSASDSNRPRTVYCTACTQPYLLHTRTFAHGNTRVAVRTSKNPSPIPGSLESIHVWSKCKICSLTSPVSLLSDQAYSLSVGKFFELFFHDRASALSEDLRSERGRCEHSFFRACSIFFSFQNIQVELNALEVHRLNIVLPPRLLHVPGLMAARLNLPAAEVDSREAARFAVVANALGSLFTSISTMLQRVANFLVIPALEKPLEAVLNLLSQQVALDQADFESRLAGIQEAERLLLRQPSDAARSRLAALLATLPVSHDPRHPVVDAHLAFGVAEGITALGLENAWQRHPPVPFLLAALSRDLHEYFIQWSYILRHVVFYYAHGGLLLSPAQLSLTTVSGYEIAALNPLDFFAVVQPAIPADMSADGLNDAPVDTPPEAGPMHTRVHSGQESSGSAADLLPGAPNEGAASGPPSAAPAPSSSEGDLASRQVPVATSASADALPATRLAISTSRMSVAVSATTTGLGTSALPSSQLLAVLADKNMPFVRALLRRRPHLAASLGPISCQKVAYPKEIDVMLVDAVMNLSRPGAGGRDISSGSPGTATPATVPGTPDDLLSPEPSRPASPGPGSAGSPSFPVNPFDALRPEELPTATGMACSSTSDSEPEPVPGSGEDSASAGCSPSGPTLTELLMAEVNSQAAAEAEVAALTALEAGSPAAAAAANTSSVLAETGEVAAMPIGSTLGRAPQATDTPASSFVDAPGYLLPSGSGFSLPVALPAAGREQATAPSLGSALEPASVSLPAEFQVATGPPPIPALVDPLPKGTLIFEGSDIPVSLDNPMSIVAFCMNSPQYRQNLVHIRKRVRATNVPGSSKTSPPMLDLPIPPRPGQAPVNDVPVTASTTEAEGHPVGAGLPAAAAAAAAGHPQPTASQADREEYLASLAYLSHFSPQHRKFDFSHGATQFSCKMLFLDQFHELRRRCGVDHQAFIASMSDCRAFDARGGKSSASFFISADGRFIIKQVNRPELFSLQGFMKEYFNHMIGVLNWHQPVESALAKILGIFRISIKRPGGSIGRTDYIVMENVFFSRPNISRKYDLKGSLRSRYAPLTGDSNDVLLDENLLETMHSEPLYVYHEQKHRLMEAIRNDSELLVSCNIIDYSLLVGVDPVTGDLVAAIVDYIRTYTWDKKLERWVKETGLLGGGSQAPTILSPQMYQDRFRRAIDSYLQVVPESHS
ncbi:hypothetical protein H696_03179 [Fonticula alba]|uniref:PIPK domain-containing protein n=1 Tax=Fonticula alba TaxID=691883 RepID=A0A058ZBL8_FONAL|nr:hypothetical protein H696_03179 [Fonticula alba]KCV70822.1 hypothetical protein H696_03179 [Fonticula alba]|eukprot:XP_009495338.1 hypothetical protein H696_03179 [Fonticula alba]